ncbi:MAG: hypothetical protein AAGA75_14370 [Cyanobacteria bacterium P01_E01_bin.6]
MTTDNEQTRNQDIQKEIRAGRSFSLAEAIGREGGDFLKGHSPIPRLVQARTAMKVFLTRHLADASGALHAILLTWIQGDEAMVSRHIEQPLMALAEMIEPIINNPPMLYEFVRQVDVKWGEMNGERPHFQQPGQPAHPDDEYTHESVHQTLTYFLQVLRHSIARQNSHRTSE